MGVKHLNKFLMDNCTQHSIRKIDLKSLANKTIVIDTSIYLYKFAEKEAVVENMFLFISTFRKYNITPIFVFDGKPPIEKKELLIKRKREKLEAEEQYNAIVASIEDQATGLQLMELEKLKKRFVRVTDVDIQSAKDIMDLYGITYFESKGESDQLCAYLVKHNYAWACMSDDMDMFLYGCSRVLRHTSLTNHEVILYDTAGILSDLDMSMDSFMTIAILSGTDYNIRNHIKLSDAVKWYTEYRVWGHTNNAMKDLGFYHWLTKYTDYINDDGSVSAIHDVFNLDLYFIHHKEEIKGVIDRMPFRLEPYDMNTLRTFLREDGFIFI
jgi:hypothetical protein